MSVLLLRFAAPMQAWGSRSRFEYRDTEREPTFSGVIGIIAAAQGLGRNADLTPYRALSMVVRVDREGRLAREFQTALGVVTADGEVSSSAQMIFRDYLSDAVFHVGLTGPDELLSRAHAALMAPVFPVFLGRKSYVPAVPVIYPAGQSLLADEEDAVSVLVRHPLPDRDDAMQIGFDVPGDSTEALSARPTRFVLTSEEPTEESRQDVPLDFRINRRRYTTRFVRTEYHDVAVVRVKDAR